jgi:hypothetical protein
MFMGKNSFGECCGAKAINIMPRPDNATIKSRQRGWPRKSGYLRILSGNVRQSTPSRQDRGLPLRRRASRGFPKKYSEDVPALSPESHE